MRALIWDRPNCGESAVCFSGPSESLTNADALAGLLRPLNLGPALLIGGASDFHQPREPSEAVHAMIPGAQIAEPPWGDREWMERLQMQASGVGLFSRWPLLAPQIRENTCRRRTFQRLRNLYGGRELTRCTCPASPRGIFQNYVTTLIFSTTPFFDFLQ